MKISFNWLKDYIDIQDSPEKIGQILTDTGLEVEGIEAFETVKGGLKGIVIGEVLTCEKHPNADKLKVTTVDIGNGQISPIVCGAPNVAKGQKVVVATVNTTLYPFNAEPFKIKKAKIRGEISEGMICAEDEIGLGSDHAGIIVLDTKLANGTPAAEYFELENDYIFEIGLTPNRSDATSHIGTARDLKAATGKEIKWPSVEAFGKDDDALKINVKVENKEACPRYTGVTITNVTVKESPEWLKNKLRAVGLSPINNIVDITNYVLHEIGQPLHAFDADKIKGHQVIVKTAKEGQKFTTLDEKERTLTNSDLMICDGNEEGMCIAGVFGGIHSGVTSQTSNVFLESAYFSADYIRKTSQKHQLKTDASFRYERGTDPEITIFALKRAALLIKELAGGQISSDIIDIYPQNITPAEVAVSYKNINRLIGQEIPIDDIHTILKRLDFTISSATAQGFLVKVPLYRVDVTREADVIEEILRIYGFNNILIDDSNSAAYLAEFPAIDKDKLQLETSGILVANGFYEVITNSLTKSSYSENDASLRPEENVVILNKLSEDLGVMRQTMLYSLLEVAAHNINRKQSDLKLFEFGKTYNHQASKYKETPRLAILMTGNLETEHWLTGTKKVAFHDLSAQVRKIINLFTNAPLQSKVIHESPYEYAIVYEWNKNKLATIGKVNKAEAKLAGVRQEIFYADINWEKLIKFSNHSIVYEEVSKFPEVRRDLSLVLDKSVSYEEVFNKAILTERKLLKEVNVFDVYEGEKIATGKKAYAMSFILQDKQKTLNDKVIDKTMEKLMSTFENDLGAIIRK